jgi:hypothetical protein
MGFPIWISAGERRRPFSIKYRDLAFNTKLFWFAAAVIATIATAYSPF